MVYTTRGDANADNRRAVIQQLQVLHDGQPRITDSNNTTEHDVMDGNPKAMDLDIPHQVRELAPQRQVNGTELNEVIIVPAVRTAKDAVKEHVTTTILQITASRKAKEKAKMGNRNDDIMAQGVDQTVQMDHAKEKAADTGGPEVKAKAKPTLPHRRQLRMTATPNLKPKWQHRSQNRNGNHRRATRRTIS